MVWEISERKSLEQIEKYNAASNAWYAKNKDQQHKIKDQIAAADKKIVELRNKLYHKEQEGHDHHVYPIELKSKYPEVQELLDQAEAWASIVQFEPKFDSVHVYLINGHWYDIHASFGPFRDSAGEIIDKNDIDWENPIINKKEYEVKKRK